MGGRLDACMQPGGGLRNGRLRASPACTPRYLHRGGTNSTDTTATTTTATCVTRQRGEERTKSVSSVLQLPVTCSKASQQLRDLPCPSSFGPSLSFSRASTMPRRGTATMQPKDGGQPERERSLGEPRLTRRAVEPGEGSTRNDKTWLSGDDSDDQPATTATTGKHHEPVAKRHHLDFPGGSLDAKKGRLKTRFGGKRTRPHSTSSRHTQLQQRGQPAPVVGEAAPWPRTVQQLQGEDPGR